VQIDNLVYNYGAGATLSNKLLSVTDNTTNTTDKLKGFTDGNTSGNDYTYDANGNMLTDKNKGITTNIVYNYLNLPERIVKGTSSITYQYDATGRKLGQDTLYAVGSKFTEYIGPWVFENNQLMFMQHDEGRVIFEQQETLFEQKTVFTTTANAPSLFTATANATVTSQSLNGNDYVKVGVTTGVVLNKLGASAIGGTFTVTEGERYTLRVKGFSNSSRAANLYIKGNSTDLVTKGSALPTGSANEMWVEQSLVIPPNISQMTVGVLYSATNAATSSDYLMINDV